MERTRSFLRKRGRTCGPRELNARTKQSGDAKSERGRGSGTRERFAQGERTRRSRVPLRACGFPKTIRPGNLAVPGPNWGVGVRHALFPGARRWALSLSRAVCFPTPLSAACGCFGLMAGPFRPFPIGIYRVRPLRPVRTLPAGSGTPDVVRTRLQWLSLASAPLPRGRLQLVAGRWPRVTGLTS